MRRQSVIVALAAAVLAPLLAIATPATGTAVAATVDPTPPVAAGQINPLNVRPSIVTGSIPGGLTGSPAGNRAVMQALAIFAVAPADWTSIAQARSSGVLVGTERTRADVQAAIRERGASLTPAARDAVTARTSTYAVPSTRAATLARAAGAGGAALGTYQLGTMIGGGVVSLFGVDAEGTTCALTGAGSTLLPLIAGVDCGTWRSSQAEARRNLDQTLNLKGAQVCNDVGRCVEVVGGEWYPTYDAACVRATGSGTMFWVRDGQGLEISAQTNRTSCGGISGGFDRMGEFRQSAVAGNPSAGGPFVSIRLQNSNGTPTTAVPFTGTRANPARQIRCTVTGTDGNTYTADSATYTENDAGWASPVCPQLPDGVLPSRTSFAEVTAGTARPLSTQDTTPEWRTAQRENPECAIGVCQLRLERDGTSCFSGIDCSDWWSQRDTGTYTCRYGVAAVPMSECTVYREAHTADPARRTLSDPETGTTPVPNSGPGNSPSTGQPNPAAPTNPGTDAGTVPGGAGAPGPGSSGPERACWPTGWAMLNPVEWVLRPLQCAFVPSQANTDAQTAKITTAWNRTAPAVAAGVVDGWEFTGTTSTCGGIPYAFNFGGGGLMAGKIADACDPMFAPIAPIFRALFTAGVVVAGVFGIVRSVAGVIAFRGLDG